MDEIYRVEIEPYTPQPKTEEEQEDKKEDRKEDLW